MQRLALTYRYLGTRMVLWRALTFPLRFTPLRLPLGLGTPDEQHLYAARRWHRRQGPPVHVVRPGEALAAPDGHDLLVLGEALEPTTHAVAAMQYAAHVQPGAAVVAGRIVAGSTVESAGLCRRGGQLVGRYQGHPGGDGPVGVEAPVLSAAEDLAFIRGDVLAGSPPSVASASARAWAAGERVVYLPSVVAARSGGRPPLPVADPAALEPRTVRTVSDRLRIVYVTERTSVGGGHRDIFEHLNRLRARGHEVALFSLDGQPDWFPLEIAVRKFDDWPALIHELAEVDALKIATWWRSAEPVWLASRRRGVPVYFVQDVETSYYPDDPDAQARVLATYRPEFRYLTISGYNRDNLASMGLRADVGGLGIDLDTFRPLGRERREDMLLAVGRGNPLKNLDLTVDGWKALGEGRPELCLFGIEPELGRRHGARYVTAPTDEQVNELFNEATIFIQTSRHEGFALPPLEAMATGGAVVCTDAHGNRDFCRDGVNCLMPEPTVESVCGALERLLSDPGLRARLGESGVRTAAEYAWEKRIDELERFYERVAAGAELPTPQPGISG